MPNTPIWKGSKEIHEIPGSPRRVTAVSGEKVTRVFRGPYFALVAAKPAIGQEMADLPGVYVESVEIAPERAGPSGPGRMTVQLANEGTASGIETPQDTQPVYEVEWVAIEKPIELHPRFNGTNFGGASLRDEIIFDGTANTPVASILEQIMEASNSRTRVEILEKVASESPNHANLLYDIASKLSRGMDRYLVPSPVARRTSVSYTNSATTAQGTIDNPPAEIGAPAGYVYLKSGDSSLRQGSGKKWERIEEWQGADSWDTDLY